MDEQDVEATWISQRDIVCSTVRECFGPSTRRYSDWFDKNHAEIIELIRKKHAAHIAHLYDPQCTTKKDALRNIHGTVQLKLREMPDSWLSATADEIQGYADKNDIKTFTVIWRKSTVSPVPTHLCFWVQIKPSSYQRRTISWRGVAEHFDGVLNRQYSINDKAIERLPYVPVNESLDVTPTLGEVKIAIRQLSSGKAPGSDSIPAEIYKKGGSALMSKHLTLVQLIWVKEQLPQDLKDVFIIHIYKRKGNRQACNNHRGISLLSISGKILAKVLLNRLNNHFEHELLPESQCGFRKECGTNLVFAAREVSGKKHWPHLDLGLSDHLSRSAKTAFGESWQNTATTKNSSPSLDNFMSACIQGSKTTRKIAQLFPSQIGLSRDVSWSPLFNLRRLQAKTKVKTDIVNEFLFADDCALNATTKANMQNIVDKLSMACDNFGLTISTKKTEVMHQLAPGKP